MLVVYVTWLHVVLPLDKELHSRCFCFSIVNWRSEQYNGNAWSLVVCYLKSHWLLHKPFNMSAWLCIVSINVRCPAIFILILLFTIEGWRSAVLLSDCCEPVYPYNRMPWIIYSFSQLWIEFSMQSMKLLLFCYLQNNRQVIVITCTTWIA